MITGSRASFLRDAIGMVTYELWPICTWTTEIAGSEAFFNQRVSQRAMLLNVRFDDQSLAGQRSARKSSHRNQEDCSQVVDALLGLGRYSTNRVSPPTFNE